MDTLQRIVETYKIANLQNEKVWHKVDCYNLIGCFSLVFSFRNCTMKDMISINICFLSQFYILRIDAPPAITSHTGYSPYTVLNKFPFNGLDQALDAMSKTIAFSANSRKQLQETAEIIFLPPHTQCWTPDGIPPSEPFVVVSAKDVEHALALKRNPHLPTQPVRSAKLTPGDGPRQGAACYIPPLIAPQPLSIPHQEDSQIQLMRASSAPQPTQPVLNNTQPHGLMMLPAAQVVAWNEMMRLRRAHQLADSAQETRSESIVQPS